MSKKLLFKRLLSGINLIEELKVTNLSSRSSSQVNKEIIHAESSIKNDQVRAIMHQSSSLATF